MQGEGVLSAASFHSIVLNQARLSYLMRTSVSPKFYQSSRGLSFLPQLSVVLQEIVGFICPLVPAGRTDGRVRHGIVTA